MTKYMRQRRRLLTAIVVLSLILTLLCGVAYAKYFKNDTVSGQITVQADIGSITLQEHKAVRKPDGSYYLLTDEIVAGNTYTLIPGLDVPKDPHVIVDKANDMPVYIYVEVVDVTVDAGITYTPADGWIELVSVTGPNGGKVYYYNTPVTANATLDFLKDNKIYVSQDLDKSMSNLQLEFFAYMYQTAAGNTPAAVFGHYNGTP